MTRRDKKKKKRLENLTKDRETRDKFMRDPAAQAKIVKELMTHICNKLLEAYAKNG